MGSFSKKEEPLVRYLLGQASEPEQEQIERRYFSDNDFYEQLEVVEDDLIDAYVSGRLSGSEREYFEQHFLRYPDRQERVEFAREWRAVVSKTSEAATLKETPKRQSPFSFFRKPVVLIPVAASLVLAIGVIWLALQLIRLSRELEQAQSQRAVQERSEQELQQQIAEERRRSDELLQELESERITRIPDDQTPRSSLPIISTFILTPGLSRGAGEPRNFRVPPDATQVALKAVFRLGNYRSYAVELQTVEGRVIWSQRGLKATLSGTDRVVTATLPAKVLKAEDYIVIVRGMAPTGQLNDVAEYSLRIVE